MKMFPLILTLTLTPHWNARMLRRISHFNADNYMIDAHELFCVGVDIDLCSQGLWKMMMFHGNKPLRLIFIFFFSISSLFFVGFMSNDLIDIEMRHIDTIEGAGCREEEGERLKYLNKRLSTHNVIFKIHKSHYREMFIAPIFSPSYGFCIYNNETTWNEHKLISLGLHLSHCFVHCQNNLVHLYLLISQNESRKIGKFASFWNFKEGKTNNENNTWSGQYTTKEEWKWTITELKCMCVIQIG